MNRKVTVAGILWWAVFLLWGCAARKLPDPSRQNVWMCRKVIDEKPRCAQVWPADKVPKGAKCKALPQTGGSELVVCEK